MAESHEAVVVGRRVRAALILAGRSTKEIAPELNIATRTLDRVISGQRELREWELGRLAQILSVPEWFFREGLAGQPTLDQLADDELRDRLAQQHDEVMRRLDQLAEQMRVLSADRGLSRR